MLDIRIDEESKEYIKEKNLKAISLYVQGCQSWGGVYYQPAVGEGIPSEKFNEHYNLYKVEDLDVYVRDDVRAGKNGLQVYLGSFYFRPKLFVKGMV